MNKNKHSAYWRANLKLMAFCLSIWFLSSFGFGILFVDQLNMFRIGGIKLGFWFAQQGSIYFFIVIIFVYVFLMNWLDKKFYSESKKTFQDEGE